MSNTNSGVGHWMSGGVPGHLVTNRKGQVTSDQVTSDKEGTHALRGGIDWPTKEESGRAASGKRPRKEGKAGVGCRRPRGKERAPRGFLGAWRGLIGLPAIAR